MVEIPGHLRNNRQLTEMKKILPFVLLLLLLTGCSAKKEAYQVTWLDAFDTVINMKGYASSQKEFDNIAQQVHQELLECHQLFDVYNDYPDTVNLKTVNDNAGIAPVTVDERIMELLTDCRDFYSLTNGRVNAAMGSVLRLWHDARTAGLDDPAHAFLPDRAALEAAAEHISFDTVLLDEANRTVFITDSRQLLDVGAIAKGWTGQRLSELLPDGYLLSLGGNVVAKGTKPDGSSWSIGVQSPFDLEEYLLTVEIASGSLVTSGDYQRYYEVDGKTYHHIIDPDTLMPSEYWRSVTILCPDSGLADCLSTALFLLPLEEGEALIEKCGAEALWIDAEGDMYPSENFFQ